MLLGCQRKLAYSKPSLAPAGSEDILGRRDFGHEGEALSLGPPFGGNCFPLAKQDLPYKLPLSSSILCPCFLQQPNL